MSCWRFDSNWIAPLGSHVDAFEAEIAERLGARHAVGLSSGTAALHLALLLAGVQPGDRVVTATLTFAATAKAIRYVGAQPVFIDAEASSWNLDPDLLAEELADSADGSRLPAAIVTVDLYGQCCDYDRILPLAAEYAIPVIEDAAEAVGATYSGRHAGTFGELGYCRSTATKIMTTSGGGMLLTDDEQVAERARSWPLRPATPLRTTSTPRSATTTGCPTCRPRSVAVSSPDSTRPTRRDGRPSTGDQLCLPRAPRRPTRHRVPAAGRQGDQLLADVPHGRSRRRWSHESEIC